ncbi:MAG: hypothetical protein ABJA90_00025 [Ginsengibacter sp.]
MQHFMLVDNFDFKINYHKAHVRAIAMVENELYSRFGLSNESRIEKALLGCIGELAFEHMLIQKKFSFKVDRENYKSRNSDEYDFLINSKKLDVKVAKKSTSNHPNDNWTYGYPSEQKPALKDFIIVGWVDFINEAVGFYGWTTGNLVDKCPVVNSNSYKGYKYLTPNHEFKWGALNKSFEQLFENIFAPAKFI